MGLQILTPDGFQYEFTFLSSWGPQIITFSPVVTTATSGDCFQTEPTDDTRTAPPQKQIHIIVFSPFFYIKFSTLYYIF